MPDPDEPAIEVAEAEGDVAFLGGVTRVIHDLAPLQESQGALNAASLMGESMRELQGRMHEVIDHAIEVLHADGAPDPADAPVDAEPEVLEGAPTPDEPDAGQGDDYDPSDVTEA